MWFDHQSTKQAFQVKTLCAAAALLCLAGQAASAHILEFTPTDSVGTRLWRNPTSVEITFRGPVGMVDESLVSGLGVIGSDKGVRSYADGLTSVSESGGLLRLHGTPDETYLTINTAQLFVDDIRTDEIAVRGDLEGYGSDGITPCGTFAAGPFAGGCEADGFWTLDGARIPDPPGVPEPPSWTLLGVAMLAGWVVGNVRPA